MMSERDMEVVPMMFEDKFGNLLHPDELDELSPWEIEERQVHVYDEFRGGMCA